MVSQRHKLTEGMAIMLWCTADRPQTILLSEFADIMTSPSLPHLSWSRT